MFKEPEALKHNTWQMTYAHRQTERHYDEYPPNDDLVPIAAAINAWTLVCGCYMGIEQTMKLLILMQRGIKQVPRELRIHDLSELYSSLDKLDRHVVAKYYRVYRSLHNFDSSDVVLDTADQFIEYIGGGYTSWRYILIEDSSAVPKVHIGLMLETWRALVYIARNYEVGGSYATIEQRIASYIERNVIVSAEGDDAWQRASQDRDGSTDFTKIREWVIRNGGLLQVGVMLFDHRKREGLFSPGDSALLRKVIYRAAKTAVRSPITGSVRKADIAMFLHRIHKGGLAWNEEKRVFE